MTETAAFYVLAFFLVMSAGGVVMARNPVHAAMSLVAAFFLLAGVYVLLAAHLVAVLQVLVYAGAIMVLFLFVIMLLSLSDEELGLPRWKAVKLLGAAGGLGLLWVIIRAVRQLGFLERPSVGDEFGTVRAVGRMLFTEYLLPFEATSVLLLVAIVGAVVVAKARI
jgi:NADH-quinone oxidoreductase subunit J